MLTHIELDGEVVPIPDEVRAEGTAAVEHWLAAEKARRAAAKKQARKTAPDKE